MNVSKLLTILIKNISLILWALGWLSFTVAGFLFAPIAGFIVLGIGLLISSYLININGGD
jgi:hypothetical protein